MEGSESCSLTTLFQLLYEGQKPCAQLLRFLCFLLLKFFSQIIEQKSAQMKRCQLSVGLARCVSTHIRNHRQLTTDNSSLLILSHK